MEKRTPHCKLSVIKQMVEAGKVRATWSARTGAAELGFDFAGMVEVVGALTRKDFYKSTPTIPFGKACIATRQRQARFI